MPLSRRRLIQGGLALPVLAAEKPAVRPNLLLMIADNLPARVLGCYGSKEVHTPNLDRLARVGTRFVNHVACAPAPEAGRATLLTGRTPMQLGGAGAAGAADITLDKLLGGVGYAVLTANSAGDAAKLIGQQTVGKPWSLTVALSGLRAPYEGVPQKFRDLYAQTKFETLGYQPAAANAQAGREMLGDIVGSLRLYAAALSALDDGVGAALAALRQSQLQNSTLVVFTSTCGALLGRHGLWDGAPASDPPNLYQQTVLTPMIWSWPVRIPTDLSRPEVVGSYDLLPAICEAVSVPPPDRNLCGRSYLSLATGNPLPRNQPWRTTAFAHYGNTDMARDSRYKVVIRDGGKGPNELFDLVSDPGEAINQYDNEQFITLRNSLSGALANWKKNYSA
jgi:arylsulfatase A